MEISGGFLPEEGAQLQSDRSMLYSYPLTEDVKRYVQRVLERGLSLSKAVIARWADFSDTVQVSLPSGSAIEHLPKLEHGGIASWPASRDVLANDIRSFLSSAGHVVVFEHSLARPSDASLRKQSIEPALLGDEVYFTLLPGDSNEAIESVISSVATATGFVGIFFDNGVKPTSRQSFIKIASDDNIEGLSKVVIGAFDGESFLYLERQGSPSDSGRAAVAPLQN